MNEEATQKKVVEIINSYFFDQENDLSTNDKLHILLSESTQALSLITTLEDEFEFEFDDEDIDLEFFLSADIITQKILQNKSKEGLI